MIKLAEVELVLQQGEHKEEVVVYNRKYIEEAEAVKGQVIDRTRSRGRSCGRRSHSARGRWQGSKEQRDFEKPEREPLKIESICTKTDSHFHLRQ